VGKTLSEPISKLGKTVLVLCDSSVLYRVIESSLPDPFGVRIERALANVPQDQPFEPDHLAMVILALSSPTHEPLVVLSRANLVGLIGQVPLLIISDRPFRSHPAELIFHLDFPFRPEALRDRVREALPGLIDGLE
jgi:hypothetical protein